MHKFHIKEKSDSFWHVKHTCEEHFFSFFPGLCNGQSGSIEGRLKGLIHPSQNSVCYFCFKRPMTTNCLDLCAAPPPHVHCWWCFQNPFWTFSAFTCQMWKLLNKISLIFSFLLGCPWECWGQLGSVTYRITTRKHNGWVRIILFYVQFDTIFSGSRCNFNICGLGCHQVWFLEYRWPWWWLATRRREDSGKDEPASLMWMGFVPLSLTLHHLSEGRHQLDRVAINSVAFISWSNWNFCVHGQRGQLVHLFLAETTIR